MRKRPVQWRTIYLRPEPTPMVRCPRVHTIGIDGYREDWLGVNHCAGCAFCGSVFYAPKSRTGEVVCDG